MSAEAERPFDVAAALAAARAAGVARLDAQLLLSHILGRPRSWLLAHDDERLAPGQAAVWAALLARRAAGEPLAYVIGELDFRGLRLHVTHDVLVPRPETEVLVEWAIERLVDAPAQSLVDLGTGSGVIALALQKAYPLASVSASDRSGAALALARLNATRHGLSVVFEQGDWWAPFAGQRFGLAVSNPPYVAADDPHLRELRHEPLEALTPGGNGLAALASIIRGAPRHLLCGGWLLLEHGHDQGEAVRRLLLEAGFGPPSTRADLAGQARCSGASWQRAKGATRHSS